MGKGGEKAGKTVPVVERKHEKFDRKDFYMSEKCEPHVIRRKQILEKHPEIVDLMKPDSRPVPYVVAMVLVQLVIAANARNMSWAVYLSISYFIGGTIGHSLALMGHECSHNLIFEYNPRSIDYNFCLALFANIGMGVPSAASFKIYHMEHHQFQGSKEKDVDIPTVLEGKLFKGALMKILFIVLQPFLYGLRPSIIRPKNMSTKEKINYAFIVATNFVLGYFFGIGAVGYLLLGQILGMGLHPMAGHLLAEHYVFDGNDNFETYSYYGFWNKFAWNVGYHNEHHDFPRIPGWRLPEVKRIAPEFYEDLPQVDCWVMCLVNFVMDPNVSPFCRVQR